VQKSITLKKGKLDFVDKQVFHCHGRIFLLDKHAICKSRWGTEDVPLLTGIFLSCLLPGSQHIFRTFQNS